MFDDKLLVITVAWRFADVDV